jgi:curli biogenesis system outer membrane secretion channel CsgG
MQSWWRAALGVFLMVVVPGACMAQSGGLRYSITVSKFENRAGWHGQWDIGDAWGAVLTDLLSQTGRFIVLGEADMRTEALAEQDFAATGRTAGGKKTPVTGQMTPAQLLVKGAITHVQGDTAGGGGGISLPQGLSVGYSGHGFSGDADAFKNDNVGKAVEAACAEAVGFLVAQLPKIPWTGTVVMTKDGKVYVNRGTREGVSVGQAFVVGESETVRDPDTGEVLDESLTEVARLEVAAVKEKLSICSVSSGNAAAIVKGMSVHPR